MTFTSIQEFRQWWRNVQHWNDAVQQMTEQNIIERLNSSFTTHYTDELPRHTQPPATELLDRPGERAEPGDTSDN